MEMYLMPLLTVCTLVLEGVAGEECGVTGWTAWGLCEPGRRLGRRAREIPAGGPADRSRESMDAMATIRSAKEVNYRSYYRCRLAGTCPFGPKLSTHTCINGNSGGYACNNIDLMAYVPTDDLVRPLTPDNQIVTTSANDIWGWTDPVTGIEWALVGLSTGTSCVSLENPANPTPMAFIPTRSTPSLWRDLKVVDNTLYIVAEAFYHGLQVFDLTRLRGLTEFKTLYHDSTLKSFGSAHNIVAHETKKEVYVVGARPNDDKDYQTCNAGLMIVDVSSPLQPKLAGCYSTDGYTHDAQCLIYNGPDNKYKGKSICFAFNEDTLTIVDIDDPTNAKQISRTSYQGFAYTHQGWLSEDHTLLLLDDELDEYLSRDSTKRTRTLIWDVTKLESPVLSNIYWHETYSIDHNQYVKGDFTYQTNYEAGLRILKIDKSNWSLHEVAFFDVHEGPDATDFYGAWSNYPYFQSGIVVVSSIEKGLFVVRPNMANINAAANKPSPQGVRRRSRSYEPGSDTEQCSEQLIEEEVCSFK